MSDLISRNELIEALMKCKQLGRKSFEVVANVINAQSPAYDVSKVIEEIKEMSGIQYDCSYGRGCEFDDCIHTPRAIEIVKQGGVSDDSCEWKFESDGEFIQNPHTKRLYSNEPSVKNFYCNTCGKKIKAVK